MKPIRLACLECDDETQDGIAELPADWTDVSEVEDGGDGSWWTHLGMCPECGRDHPNFSDETLAKYGSAR
jgi:hypothetical protein